MDTNQNRKSYLSSYTLVFFSCLLIFALRNNLNGIFYPTLMAEDGTHLFLPFYNGDGVGYIFEYWNGYLYIIPKTIAYLLSFLPANQVPHSYAIFAMTLASTTFVILYEMLLGFFGNRFALYSTLVIAIMPLGFSQLITSLSFTIWNMLLILIFLYFIPIPKSKTTRFLYCLAVVAMIWSHPLSLLMLPLYIYMFFSRPDNKWVYGFFSLSALLYYWFGIISKTVVLSKLYILPNVLLRSVVIGGIFGPTKSFYIIEYDRILIYGILVLFFLLIFLGLFWSERNRDEKELFFAALYLIIGTVALSILGGNHNQNLLFPGNGTRYFYAAKTLLWILIFSACIPLIKRHFNIACIHALLIGFVLMNNTIGPYNSLYKYYTSLKRGEDVFNFVNRIPAHKMHCLNSLIQTEYTLRLRGSKDWDVRVKGCGLAKKLT